MIIEISITNFRSIRDQQTFTLVSSGRDELVDNYVDSSALSDLKVLRSAAIYGPNASGKSNLVKAIKLLKNLIRYSADESSRENGTLNDPFLFDSTSRDKPTEIEVTFLIDDVRYQYGISISKRRIEKEWLIAYPKKNAQNWFSRDHTDESTSAWNWSAFLKGEKQRLADRTRPDSLFLSVASRWNHDQLSKIAKYFRSTVRVIDHNLELNKYTVRRYKEDEAFRNWADRVLKSADVGISKIQIDQVDVEDITFEFPDSIPEKLKEMLTDEAKKEKVLHYIESFHYNPEENKEYGLGFSEESDGTQRLFDLLGPWEDTLKRGYVIFVDELDRSMHTVLSRELIKCFHNPQANLSNAQLIFTTHDTNLLDLNLFRRDQIWFTEKSKCNATSLYSLYDFRPRKNEAIESGYLQGRYGAIPFIPNGLGE